MSSPRSTAATSPPASSSGSTGSRSTGYRRAYGANLNDSLLEQMGIDQRILQQMIDEEASLAEADRLGIEATDGELRARIMSLPSFKDENGQVHRRRPIPTAPPHAAAADAARPVRRRSAARPRRHEAACCAHRLDYRDRRRRRRGVSSSQREGEARASCRSARTSSGRESPQRRGDVGAFRGQNKETYRLPEKRKVKYLLIDAQALRARVTVTPQEIQDAYRENQQQYSTPEQVKSQPHPAEDRRGQERRGRAEAGRSAARQGQVGRRLRRFARPTPKTTRTKTRAATSVCSAAVAWSPSSSRRRSRWNRAR